MTSTMAAPDGTGPYGLGHRCKHCGTRIDLAHVSDTDPSEFGWVHDQTGDRECANCPNCTPEGLCDDCYPRAMREVFQELYETDPAFRAEADRWFPVDSPEGQHILSSIEQAS